MRIIAVVSAKGGVGKTTICTNLGAALRSRGCPVVAVDLDPQNALRFHMGLDANDIRGSSRSALQAEGLAPVCFATRTGSYVIPYGSVNEDDRQDFERLLDGHPRWFAENLAQLDLPDDAIVILDTPPGPSVYLRQALRAAELVLIATLPDAASYATVPMIEGLVETYCKRRPDFLGYGYVINQVNSSRQLARDVTQVMLDNLGARVTSLVHQDQAVSEALAAGTSVLEYDQNSQGALDFVNTARWILDRLADIGQPA